MFFVKKQHNINDVNLTLLLLFLRTISMFNVASFWLKFSLKAVCFILFSVLQSFVQGCYFQKQYLKLLLILTLKDNKWVSYYLGDLLFIFPTWPCMINYLLINITSNIIIYQHPAFGSRASGFAHDPLFFEPEKSYLGGKTWKIALFECTSLRFRLNGF